MPFTPSHVDIAELLRRVSRHIAAVHKAFGALGDYGYGSKQGDSLFDLYRTGADVAEMTAAIDPPPAEGER